jgi:hypothetical protein
MQITTVAHLIPVMQTAIGPAILISGVGLLLLTMTNRFGRLIDRTRILSTELMKSGSNNTSAIQTQLAIMLNRARFIRLAIILAAMSALSAALLIIVLFCVALMELEAAWLLGALFIACLASLIGSLLVFIMDINRSLVALKLELPSDMKGEEHE